MVNSRVLTIIGMGEGISMSVARKFGKEGFTIAMISRSDEKLSQYQKQLQKEKIEAYYYLSDVSDSQQLTSCLEYIHESLGITEVMLYNAAAIRQVDLLQIPEDEAIMDFKVNTLAALIATQSVAKLMANEGGGKIFYTGGGLSLEPNPKYGSLAIGKAGLRNLALSLHQQLKSQNIHVATVTVNGFVQKEDDKYHPDHVAEQFWKLYQQEGSQQEAEIIY